MYYRYKSKKSRKIYKIFFLILLISYSVYLGYKYQNHIFFWKFTYNKLAQKIDEVENFKNITGKKGYLIELSKICNEYKDENRLSNDTSFLSGEVHFLLGETLINESFSQLIINDNLYKIDSQAKSEFYQVIKDVLRGIALSRDDTASKYYLILAKAIFYLDYCNIKDIYKLIKKIEINDIKHDTESIRFYGIINILNDSAEDGINIIKRYGRISDGMEGMLFFATANQIAKRFTVSIMGYKQVIDKTSDNKIIKLVHINLGKIYYNQSLFKESLYYFNQALNIDERDNLLKIWIGKNYSALGYKTRAKAIWSEVLASDHSNKEVRKLLGLM